MKITQKLLQRMRRIGFIAFFGNTFLFLIYSVFVAFDLFVLFPAPNFRLAFFWILFIIMLGSFLLMFIGSRLQNVIKKADAGLKERIEKTNLKNLSELELNYFVHQQDYAPPPDSNRKGTIKVLLITSLVIGVAIVFGVLSIQPLAQGFYAYSVSLGSITVGCLIALVSGNITEDVWRTYIAGYHVHESFVGIYFAIIGGPMMIIAISPVEYYVGLIFIVAGVFLIGRDWKDVVKGEILVHKSTEPDYEQYIALKAKKDELQGS